MASSSPPPLIPINGSNNICYREKHNSAASKPVNRLELQSGEFSNRESHVGFKTTNPSTNDKSPYHQQQSNHYYIHPHQFTTQSQAEINKSQSCQSTRPNPPEIELLPVTDIPADLLLQHHLQKEKTFNHKELISDFDCYWYRKNLENVNTIYSLRKEITDLRKKLIAAENHRCNMGVNKTLTDFITGREKRTKKNNVFTCETCRRDYKTERGLEKHQRHCRNGPNQ